jgi:hypothetical protein
MVKYTFFFIRGGVAAPSMATPPSLAIFDVCIAKKFGVEIFLILKLLNNLRTFIKFSLRKS